MIAKYLKAYNEVYGAVKNFIKISEECGQVAVNTGEYKYLIIF